LLNLRNSLKDNEAAIIEACKLDLGKPSYETFMGEVMWCLNDIIFVCNHLEKWMADEKAPDIDLRNTVVNPKIRKEPLGTVLIIGWVYYSATSSLVSLLTNSITVHSTTQSSSPLVPLLEPSQREILLS
jgi:beta-apo-4'-carotenal oxygenase